MIFNIPRVGCFGPGRFELSQQVVGSGLSRSSEIPRFESGRVGSGQEVFKSPGWGRAQDQEVFKSQGSGRAMTMTRGIPVTSRVDPLSLAS